MAQPQSPEMQKYLNGIGEALAIAEEWKFTRDEKVGMLGLELDITNDVKDLAAHCAKARTHDIRTRCMLIAKIYHRMQRARGGAAKALHAPFSESDRRTRRQMITSGDSHDLRLVYFQYL